MEWRPLYTRSAGPHKEKWHDTPSGQPVFFAFSSTVDFVGTSTIRAESNLIVYHRYSGVYLPAIAGKHVQVD